MNRRLQLTTSILTVLVLALLVFLSVRGITDPRTAALSFGVPVGDGAGAFYHHAYRSRNLTLAVVGLVFLLRGMWRALAILTTTAISLPAYDMLALTLAHVPVRAVHPVTLVVLGVLAPLLWRRTLHDEPAARPADH